MPFTYSTALINWVLTAYIQAFILAVSPGFFVGNWIYFVRNSHTSSSQRVLLSYGWAFLGENRKGYVHLNYKTSLLDFFFLSYCLWFWNPSNAFLIKWVGKFPLLFSRKSYVHWFLYFSLGFILFHGCSLNVYVTVRSEEVRVSWGRSSESDTEPLAFFTIPPPGGNLFSSAWTTNCPFSIFLKQFFRSDRTGFKF